jgi:hypothetical protein
MLAAAPCTAACPAAQCRLRARPGTEVRPAVIAAWRATTPPPYSPFAEHHVVDQMRVQLAGRCADDMLRQPVSVGIAQRALHRGADGRAQRGNDHGFRHRCLHLDRYENAILSG